MDDHYDRYNGMEKLLGTNLAQLGTDCISRQQAIKALSTITMYKGSIPYNTAVMRIEQLPSAQPERGAIEQIKWERDVAIEQLKKLGYGLGEKIIAEKDCISRQAAIDALEKCYTCKHVYQRVSDADTLYCRCRKGCRYEEVKPRRSGESPRRNEG